MVTAIGTPDIEPVWKKALAGTSELVALPVITAITGAREGILWEKKIFIGGFDAIALECL